MGNVCSFRALFKLFSRGQQSSAFSISFSEKKDWSKLTRSRPRCQLDSPFWKFIALPKFLEASVFQHHRQRELLSNFPVSHL